MTALRSFVVSFFLALAGASGSPLSAQPAQAPASLNDTARFLAGMSVAAGSPLSSSAAEDNWKKHAAALDKEWASLDAKQLSKVRAFSVANLKSPSKTLFYTFSGPDFVYANAFFPSATTYVLAGLEPVGPLPKIDGLKKGTTGNVLAHLRTSINHLIGFSYFITLDMDNHLRQGQMPGVLPVLYVFLARSEKTVKSVEHIRLMPDGTLAPHPYDAANTKDRPRAVKITFAGADNVERVLFYFSTNLENKGAEASGFLKFAGTLGTGDAFVKSASYLLHGSAFSTVRNFLLSNSAAILQDDSGIPLRNLDSKVWTLNPYGRYSTPIPTFSTMVQPDLKALYDKSKPPAFDFSLGYRWRSGQSNLLHAIRK